MPSILEALHAAQTGDMTGITIREVEMYGVRHPSPLARRLLDRIQEDPAAYLSALMKRRAVRVR